MKSFLGRLLIVFILLQTSPVYAESLQCNGQNTSEGDSKISVAYKCGEPVLKDLYCAAVYVGRLQQPLVEPYASAVVPCQMVEEWLYDRGPGNLMATVRFRDGVVRSITYGRSPR